jgi:hypothetical protein
MYVQGEYRVSFELAVFGCFCTSSHQTAHECRDFPQFIKLKQIRLWLGRAREKMEKKNLNYYSNYRGARSGGLWARKRNV